MNENKKVNSSILFKLNTWHLSQVFAGFLWINLIIALLFGGLIVYHAETNLSARSIEVKSNEIISKNKPNGIKLPEFLEFYISDNMQGAIRQVVTTQPDNTFWGKIKSISYRAWFFIPDNNYYIAIDYKIGDSISDIIKLFIILSIFELLFLIGSIGGGAKAIKRALKPIEELTNTAKIINKTQTVNPETGLRDLAGTIDSINATHLDTRIQINSSQKELKDLADAINGMLDRINKSYRSQVRFVSDASHELRTPIAVIQGYANLLDRWGKNDKKALEESIAAIKSEADSMKELVEQLLFLARGDNDTMQLSMEDINLSLLTDEIIRETVMIDKNHSLSSKTEADVYTVGDAQLIKQAIRIFIDNSIKYTPEGGAITVSAFGEGDIAKVLIQDEGIGIPAEDLPNVFDRFYRSDDSRTRKTGGTGLGLSIAKWIIDRHKGSVEILSRKDIGTRITISLKRNTALPELSDVSLSQPNN